MGAFYEFKILKTHADKILKFKQDVLMEGALKRGFMNQNHFKIVYDGACAAYTMTWIKHRLVAGEPGFVRHYTAPAKGANDEEDVARLTKWSDPSKPRPTPEELEEVRRRINFRRSVAAAAKGAWRQLQYKKAGAQWQHFGMALDQLASELDLEVATDDTHDEADGSPMDVIKHFSGKGPGGVKAGLDEKQAAYIALRLVNNKGHAVGLFKPYKGDTLHFFDPNVGEYKIPKTGASATESFDLFFKDYLNILDESDWKFSNDCYGMRIKRKTI